MNRTTASQSVLEEEEGDLVARLRAGDRVAFERMVRTHGPRMLATTRRYLPRLTDAEDALQDAFLSAFKALPRFEGECRLGTWLHRIAVNAALMRIRTRTRRPQESLDAVPADVAAGLESASGDGEWRVTPTQALSRRETRDGVREAVDRLPEGQRIVVVLRDIEGRPLAEVSELLGLGFAATKARLHAGRKALRRSLAALVA